MITQASKNTTVDTPVQYEKKLYKAVPQLFITDWLSRHSHKTSKDKEMPGRHITIKAIESCTDIPDCMIAEVIKGNDPGR